MFKDPAVLKDGSRDIVRNDLKGVLENVSEVYGLIGECTLREYIAAHARHILSICLSSLEWP